MRTTHYTRVLERAPPPLPQVEQVTLLQSRDDPAKMRDYAFVQFK